VGQYSASPLRTLGFVAWGRRRAGTNGAVRFGALSVLAAAERNRQRGPVGSWVPRRLGSRRPRSRRAAVRRRQVMGALVVGLVVCLLAGLVTGSSVAWWSLVTLLPVACSYLALLAWARRRQAEREFNAAFLTGAAVPAPAEFFAGLSCLKPLEAREERVLVTGAQVAVSPPGQARGPRAVSA